MTHWALTVTIIKLFAEHTLDYNWTDINMAASFEASSQQLADIWRDGLRKHIPDSRVHEANMGPIWRQRVPGGPHVGLMNHAMSFALDTVPIWIYNHLMIPV